jgi:DNA modification methylase
MIWQLGDHRLACGSSSDTALLQKLIGDEHINLVLCDPPFGVKVVQSKEYLGKPPAHKAIINDDIENEEEYRAFTETWLNAMKPYLAPKNSLYVFNSDKMLIPTVQAVKATGGKFAQLLIWAKTQAVVGRLDYLPQHELIIYSWYGTHKFHKSKDKSILVYPKPNKSKLHPTMKPVGLLRRLILNSTSIGDTVFDGFLGVGSSLLACEQTHRKCIGVEIDLDYCTTIVARWEKLTNKKAVKL